MRIFLSYVILLLVLGTQGAQASRKMQPDTRWAIKQLRAQGMKKSYLQTLKKHYDKKSFEKVLRLNLLGFLAPPSHMSLVSSKKAVDRSVKFMERNKKAFKSSTQSYEVPPEVITSLLWVETRHGKITGKFHVPSVYLHLLQANRKKNQKALFKIARKSPYSKKYSNKELRAKIKQQSEWRAKWAMEELIALEKIYLSKKKNIRTLKGSYAGAFGLPQFIPSSYRSFAVSAKANKTPNLFKSADAVHSVARYLSLHGWDNSSNEAQIEALMKYNNSRDYAESILELSEKVKSRVQQKIEHAVAQQDPT